eukprot:scaffold41602_cov27-Tisochrysis_lutea.AAC.2
MPRCGGSDGRLTPGRNAMEGRRPCAAALTVPTKVEQKPAVLSSCVEMPKSDILTCGQRQADQRLAWAYGGLCARPWPRRAPAPWSLS